MKPQSSISIVNVTGGLSTEMTDSVAVEEPLEILLSSESGASTPVSITMRTPGNDFELAVGFLRSEGLLKDRSQLASTESASLLPNKVEVSFSEGGLPDVSRLKRHFYTTSSCGVCGKASVEALYAVAPPPLTSVKVPIATSVFSQLPQALIGVQDVFDKTGGLHAAALFSDSGELLLMREDVGRHNAVDKLLGAAFLSDSLLKEAAILLLSGRSSFELIQKAVMSGIPIVASIGAPSSLAVELAGEHKVTLIGFLSDTRMNVYTGEGNIAFPADSEITEVEDAT